MREYGLLDGLGSVEGVRRQRSVVADGARIWFSLGRGLSMIDPTRPAGGSMPAITHVLGISADGTPLGLAENVRVPAGRQRLTFTYTGLSLSVPERVRFRYRLDGFDGDWSAPVTTREAIYTNLAPGPYRFRVMASNSEGQWSPAEAAVAIAIAPQLWQTTWFRVGCVVAFVLGAAGIYRLRMHQVARAAQRPVRGAARRAHAHRAGSARHAAAGICQRLDAAARRGRPCSRGFTGAGVARSRARADGTRHRRRTQRRARPALAGGGWRRSGAGVLPDAAGARQSEAQVGFRVIVEGRPRPLHPVIRDEVYRIGREALVECRPPLRRAEDRGRDRLRAGPRARPACATTGAASTEQVLDSGREGHWGLSGMRERAERIGARLKVWSAGRQPAPKWN